ncbi:MAG TPA: hypothetical protein VK689_05500, partial [Armatimonadota bacterium]|nr:hypothetical protein [Armatimonadota bacterium]
LIASAGAAVSLQDFHAHAAPSSAGEPAADVTRARLVAAALAAGRLKEAGIEAEGGVKRWPDSALLRRRLAQVRIAEAVQANAQFKRQALDIQLARNLDFFIEAMRDPELLLAFAAPDITERGRRLTHRLYEHKRRVLLTPPNLQVLARFKEQASANLKESRPLAARYSTALAASLAEVKEATRLGDTSTELALTDLWAQALVVLWRHELEGLKKLKPIGDPDVLERTFAGEAASFDKNLAALPTLTPEAVLRAAAELGRSRSSDATALAGAADVISVVTGITGRPDPLRAHVMSTLNNRYLPNPGAFNPAALPPSREAARQLYLQARDAKDPDASTAPAAAVLQLYNQALEKDPEGALPHLRLRVYLLRVAFEREAARPLLEELKRLQPTNAAVPLEQARAAAMLENNPGKALTHLREATRLAGFSRSYLVAVPAPLRRALNLHPGLQEWVEEDWPGYSGLFTTLHDTQRAQQQAAGQMEARLLRLALADRLCRAPDYPDQSQGIHQKTLVLEEMAHLGEQLPAEQRALLEVRIEQHQRAYADFPAQRRGLLLTPEGLSHNTYPKLEISRTRNSRGDERLTVELTGGS